MPDNKPKFDPNKPFEPTVAETATENKPAFNPNDKYQVVKEAASNPYYENIDKEQRSDKVNEYLSRIPDLDDNKKKVISDLILNGAPGQDIDSATLTLRGKHPKQDGGDKYYYNNKGIPTPLASDERPPQGFDVANDFHGTQEEANKKGFFESAGNHLYNGVVKGVLGLEGLANSPYAMATGKDADWYSAAKNRVESSLYKSPEYEQENQLFDTKDIKGVEDFFDPNRYNLDKNTLQGAALNGLESVTSFLVGTKGVGAAGKLLGPLAEGAGVIKEGGNIAQFASGASKAGVLANNFGGAYTVTLPEVLDYMDQNGITGTEKYRLASLIAVPIAATEMIGGVEGQFAKNAAAKKAKSEMIKGLVEGIAKNTDGSLTKEAVGDLFKATTSEALKLQKSFAGDLAQGIAGEAGTEALQDLEKKGLSEIYDHLSKEDKFKQDPFSLESFGEYYNSALSGAAGAGGLSTVATIQKRAIEREKKKSENIFNTVKQGEQAVNVLKKNIGKAVDDGEITPEQGADAVVQVDAYSKYNDQVSGKGLSKDDEKRVFELTFTKANLEQGIPTDYEAEKLNGIEQAEIGVKKTKAKDIQNEIEKIFLHNDTETSTGVIAKKTEEQVAKDKEKENAGILKKTKITSVEGNDVLGDEGVKIPDIKNAGDEYVYEPSKSIKNEKRAYDEIPNNDWNKTSFNFGVKLHKLAEKILKSPSKKEFGIIQIDNSFEDKGHKVDTFNVTLPDGKSVRFASSMVRKPSKSELGGYRGHTYEENFDNRDNPIGAQVGLRAYTLPSGRNVVAIFNTEPGPKYGKHLGFVKEKKEGNSVYSETDSLEFPKIQHTIEPPDNATEVESGTTIAPTPTGPADVNVVKSKVVLGQPVKEDLRTTYIKGEIAKLGNNADPSYIQEGTYERLFGKNFDEKIAPKLEGPKKEEKPKDEDVKTEALKLTRIYNGLNKTDRKSEQGVSIYKKINELADSIDHSTRINSGGKLQFVNPKGKQVYSEAVKRTQEDIDADKTDKKETKAALRMTPQSLEHLVIMDVANGEQFNVSSLKTYGDNVNEIPALMKSNKGGIDIGDYKTRLAEMMSLREGADALQGDEDTIAKKAMETLKGYLTEGGRSIAIRDAKDIYEKEINNGFTHTQVKRLAEEHGVTPAETVVIQEVVSNATEEELENIKKELSDENNQNETTVNRIASEIIGSEEGSVNPFDEIEGEQEEGNKDITTGDGPDVFQKSSELIYAEGQLVKAEAELKASKKALDIKRKELDKGLIEDQEDLFGERKSTDETSLFDERASLEGRNEAMVPFKQRYENAVVNYNKWQDRVKELGDSEESQMELFQRKSEIKGNVEKVVAHLKKSIPGIKIVYDKNMDSAGRWSPKNKTITINPYYAGIDTPIHEYGHILIDSIGYDNKVIQAAIKQLFGTKLWEEIKKAYPELSEEELGKEVLAEAIGREGAGIFEKEADKNKFQQYLDYIYDWIKTKLGINKNIAKSLAKQVLSGKVGEPVKEGKEQFQKKKEKTPEQKQRKEEKKQLRKEQREEIEKITGGKDIKDLPFDKLIELYEHIIGYEKAVQDEHFGDVKIQIAYRLFTEKKAQLEQWQKEGKVTGYSEEAANKSDIKKKDILFKNLSHMTQIVPELQTFSKMFENKFFDMTAERYTLKNELQKLGKEVIKEANKKLGITGRAKELFSSDNAKYFEYLENPNAIIGEDEDGDPIKGAGYWTLEEGKKKGFTQVQMDFLKFMHKLQEERNKQLEAMGRDATQEVLKVDKGVAESWRTEGAMQAFSAFLGNGFNLRNVRVQFTDPVTKNIETLPYGEIEKKLLGYGNKSLIEKLHALVLMFKYNMAAKRQMAKGINVDEKDNENVLQLRGGAKYGIDPHGALVNKFMKNRSKERGYSKDFYKAAFDFIDESTHSKHMQELLPYIDSIEYLNKMGLTDDEGNVLHGVKDNVAEWIKQWKDLHLFKVDKPGPLGPETDAAVKLLRSLTSQLVMGFNIKAGLINIAMGQYNNLRKETAAELKEGHKRMIKDPKKTVDILSKYQVISIDYNSNPKLFAGRLFDNLAHGLTRAGEYYIQGSMFMGLMTDEQYNSFEYKKNAEGVEELVLKPGVDEKAFKEEMIKNKNRVSDIQGKYSEKDQRNFMAGEFGKMIGQFKVWVPDWWKERFGEEYITADGQVKKGSYRNFTIDAAKDLLEQIKTEGPKAIWNNKEAMTNLKGALAVATLLSLKLGGDDDDKKRKQGDLLSQMTSNVLFVFDPSGLKFTVAHPVAALGTLEKFANVLGDAVKMDSEKLGKDISKVIPYNKAITQVPGLITGEE